MENQKAKTVFYDGTFKLKSDVELAKNTNQDIDDFTKFPVYRALKYDESKKEGIEKLCAHLSTSLLSTSSLTNGTWIVEKPRMFNGKIQYKFYSEEAFNSTFEKCNAAGILGCGEGSERFVKH